MSKARADEASAALKIQSAFRGHAARKDFRRRLEAGGFSAGGALRRGRGQGGSRALALSGDALWGDDDAGDGAVPVGEHSPLEMEQEWEVFAARQRARHVRVAPSGLITLDECRGKAVQVDPSA